MKQNRYAPRVFLSFKTEREIFMTHTGRQLDINKFIIDSTKIESYVRQNC